MNELNSDEFNYFLESILDNEYLNTKVNKGDLNNVIIDFMTTIEKKKELEILKNKQIEEDKKLQIKNNILNKINSLDSMTLI